MSKRAKLLARIRQNPKHVSFDDLRQVLEDYGFVLRAGAGTSHHFFQAQLDEKAWTLTIPYYRPHIKSHYVKEALQILDEMMALSNSDEESDDD